MARFWRVLSSFGCPICFCFYFSLFIYGVAWRRRTSAAAAAAAHCFCVVPCAVTSSHLTSFIMQRALYFRITHFVCSACTFCLFSLQLQPTLAAAHLLFDVFSSVSFLLIGALLSFHFISSVMASIQPVRRVLYEFQSIEFIIVCDVNASAPSPPSSSLSSSWEQPIGFFVNQIKLFFSNFRFQTVNFCFSTFSASRCIHRTADNCAHNFVFICPNENSSF